MRHTIIRSIWSQKYTKIGKNIQFESEDVLFCYFSNENEYICSRKKIK